MLRWRSGGWNAKGAVAGGTALSSRADILVLIVVGALAGLYAMVRIYDPDAWWLLASGRLFWQQGLPRVNSFAHTYPQHPWTHNQWLFAAVLRLWEEGGGLLGVELFQVLMVAAAFMVTFDTLRRKAGSIPLLPLLPLLLLALSASKYRFVPRPHLATYLGLSLLLNLWERRSPRLPLWFGLIGLVWANMHAGVVFGLVVTLLMAAASLLTSDKALRRSGVLGAGMFFLCSLLNPGFLEPYAYSIGHLSLGSVFTLEEFGRPSLAGNASFFAMVAAAFAAIPSSLRRRDVLYPLLLVAFLGLALFTVRLIPKFILVILPWVGAAAVRLWQGDRARSRRLFLFGGALLVALALNVRDLRLTAGWFEPGWGVNWREVPEGAARFILERRLDGRMFNDYSQGGYFAWRLFPAHRVFVDGRTNAYPLSFFREIGASATPRAWPALMDKYNVSYAVVERLPYYPRISDKGPLFETMDWPLVYLDGVSLVYVRKGSALERRTADDRFTLISAGIGRNQLVTLARREPGRLQSELERIDPNRLISSLDFDRFAEAALAAGLDERAERLFRHGLARYPDHLGFRFQLAALMARTGRPEEARREYREVVRRGNDTAIGDAAAERLNGLGSPSSRRR